MGNLWLIIGREQSNLETTTRISKWLPWAVHPTGTNRPPGPAPLPSQTGYRSPDLHPPAHHTTTTHVTMASSGKRRH